MNLVVDVSVFIDRLFIYDKERSRRAHDLFKLIDDKGLNIFEPQVFGIELASQIVRRKPRSVARKLYGEIIDKVITIDYIEYDLLLDTALSTACRAIDAYYIVTASMVSGILISADKIMVDNARKYGIEAYYIHNPHDYDKLMSKISQSTG
ncbi:MAG: type II toxin-antitoxin system VapC family toxin [Desulfurococcales archaeon]|nr:type II toxin-antitoxin system VapC family toxin [Desulfurococcales archaeon]